MKKRTIFPFIFNGELTRKVARTTVAGLLGITGCLALFTGCGDEMVEEESETVQVTHRYDGESIYFKIGDTFYEGAVVEGVSEDQVRVLLDDDSERVININQIGGTLLPDHPDLEVEVVLLGDEQKGERLFSGTVEGVYTDDARKIEIHTIRFLDGEFRAIARDIHILFVKKGTAFEEGGYLWHDEYMQWLNEQEWD